MSDAERWGDIPGYGGRYQVTSNGRVRSTAWGGGELKPFRKQRSGGGLYVNLYQDGEMRRVAVSTLVKLAHDTTKEAK